MNHSQQLEQSLGKRTELICTPNKCRPLLMDHSAINFKSVFKAEQLAETSMDKRI